MNAHLYGIVGRFCCKEKIMYRYTRRTPLATGHKYGDILRDGDLAPKIIEKFLASGTLVKEITPPLSEIPAFEKRAQELQTAGVISVTDLVEANAAEVARQIGKSPTTIRRWQSEVMTWLAPLEEEKKSG